MNLGQQQEFLTRLMDNTDRILEEYQSARVRTLALPDWDEECTPLDYWRQITLWWEGEPQPVYQKKFPFCTELFAHGPNHRATGFLILNPHSKTPQHNHEGWPGRYILHLPLIVPEGDVGFWVDGQIHRWRVGEPFVFDEYKEHYGFNNTDGTRVMAAMCFDEEWKQVLQPYMAFRT